jgi:hypothetical protein
MKKSELKRLIREVINESYSFVDAQEMHRTHPKTFEVPTDEELNALKKGDEVKVCANNKERFWVIITSIDGDKITGTVDNELIDAGGHGLNYGDSITFEKKNIYSIF